MTNGWLRFALVCEFLLAIVAVFTLWSQVGGQGHLDLIVWYWKLLLGCGLSAAIVGVTRTLMREARVFSRATIGWVLLMLVITIAMGLLTLYYHLHEAVDETDEESTMASLASGAFRWM